MITNSRDEDVATPRRLLCCLPRLPGSHQLPHAHDYLSACGIRAPECRAQPAWLSAVSSGPGMRPGNLNSYIHQHSLYLNMGNAVLSEMVKKQQFHHIILICSGTVCSHRLGGPCFHLNFLCKASHSQVHFTDKNLRPHPQRWHVYPQVVLSPRFLIMTLQGGSHQET